MLLRGLNLNIKRPKDSFVFGRLAPLSQWGSPFGGQRFAALTMASLLFFSLLSVGPGYLSAEAAKKKKGGGDAELQKTLEPMAKSLDALMGKVQSHMLFSPKDSGALLSLKFQLMDLMKDNPNNPLLVKPLFQAGVIYAGREQFIDSYEMFNYLTTNFPDNPYGIRAKSEIQQLKKLLGENYFATEGPPAAPEGKK